MAILRTFNETGKYNDNDARKSVIEYILQPCKAKGDLYGYYNIYTECAHEEMENTANNFNKNNGIRLRHWIISFSKSEVASASIVYMIGEDVVKFFKDYQVVYAVHSNTDNFHIHLVINSISFVDGSRYKGSKRDFYALNNHIKQVLSNYGIRYFRYVNN